MNRAIESETGADRIWITWERQRRNQSLSQALGAHLLELLSKRAGIRRYWELILRTLHIFFTTRASVVFVQNPSLVLTLLAVVVRRFRPWVLVVDAHNAGVYPLPSRPRLGLWIAKIAVRGSDLTLVSNINLKHVVEGRGGKVCVVPDPVPDLGEPVPHAGAPGKAVVLFICTWAADEPVGEVIRAAELLGPSVEVRITGRPKGREQEYQPIPASVVLTGFLPEEDFLQELKTADIIMDLTTRDDCLVCGAYEAVAVERPLVVSDTEALRSYFRKGTVYTENSAAGIARSVRGVLDGLPGLEDQMRNFHKELTEEWNGRRDEFERTLVTMLPVKA